MKQSRLLAVFIITTLALSALPAQQAVAAQPYSEKLTVYVAGANSLWFMRFGGINVTAKNLTSIESISGVNWYNLTALKTSSWSPDFQAFGPNGYNLLPVPYVPVQGAFLQVGASSFDDAASAASYFNAYLLASFVSYSNSSGVYTFYGSLSFNDVMPSTILRLIPAKMGGFASAVSSAALVASKSPIVSLQAVRGAGGFSRSLTVGSITSAGITSNEPNILKLFGTTVTSFGASNRSTSSSITYRFMDGIVNNTDHRASWSNVAGSGRYSLNLTAGAKVKALNVTVMQKPPLILAQRVVDTGVLMPGQNVSVSITLTDLSTNTTAVTLPYADSWWQGYGFFRLVSRENSSIPALTLEGGGPVATFSPTYVLQYTGSAPTLLTIPSASIEYYFGIGSARFYGHADTNPVTLSLGTSSPVVLSYISGVTNYGTSVGGTTIMTIVAKNVGTLTASSLTIAGTQTSGGGGLPPGGSTSRTVLVQAPNFSDTNSTRSYAVSYTTSGGHQMNTTTNTVPVIFSHSSVSIGVPAVAMSATVLQTQSGVINLTLSITAANLGAYNTTSVNAIGTLPAGLACGKLRGTGLTCLNGQLKVSYPHLAAGHKGNDSVEFDLSTPQSFVFSPLRYYGVSSGVNISGTSNIVSAPSGLVLTKVFASTGLFYGMNTKVTIDAHNRGPYNVYNLTLQSSNDTFDTITTAVLPLKYLATAVPGANLTLSYPIQPAQVYATSMGSTPVSATFFFGGTKYSLSGSGPLVSVYRPLSASVTTSPASPTEGKDFSITVTINNPSGLNVTGVHFTLKIPSGMTISSLTNATFSQGTLNVSASSLLAHGKYTGLVTAQASSGVSVPFSDGRLTFVYSGTTISGSLPSKGIVVGENNLTRYYIPTALVLVALLATALFVRRKAGASAPASPN